MQVTVKFFSFLQSITGQARLSVELPEGTALAELSSSLYRQFDGLAAIEHQTVMLINRQRASPETILRQGDDVLLLPFLGGG